MTAYERWLRIVLRVGGVAACVAVAAVVVPRSWIALAHQELGLGEFPSQPVAEYLARSLSGLYAFFGGLCLVVSFDLHRHAPTITYIGAAHVVFGPAIAVIDLTAGMPAWWACAEALGAALFGLAILLLQQKAKPVSEL